MASRSPTSVMTQRLWSAVHLAVEQIDAGNLHGFDDGIDFGGIAAFGKIGNAFNESVGHGKKDNECGAIAGNRDSAVRAE